MVKRILVFPSGTEIALEIQASLKAERWIELVGASSTENAHGKFVFDEHYALPLVTDSSFLIAANQLISERNIDYIFPAHDDAQLYLCRFGHSLGAPIISPNISVCEVLRKKSATYNLLAGTIPVPKVFMAEAIHTFPIFVKPDIGQGSQGASLCTSQQELDNALKALVAPIICEYLPGREVTVDCFTTRPNKLLYCRGRQRVRVRNGISVSTKALHKEVFEHYAEKILEKIPLFGAWFFQLKESTDGIWTLLEVAPRIAGAMAFQRVQGVNLTLLSLYEHLNYPIKISPRIHDSLVLDRALQNRYSPKISFRRVYIDFDDTVTTGDRLNTDVIKFIFQCKNRDIPVVLLSRHNGDLYSKLELLKIRQLFDDFVNITDGSRKSKYINGDDSIFIDDSFSERQEVAATLDIPVFDCSALELLLISTPY